MDDLGPFSIAELRDIVADARGRLRRCFATAQLPPIEVGRADNMFPVPLHRNARLASHAPSPFVVADAAADVGLLAARAARNEVSGGCLPPPRIVLWRSTPDFGHFILLHYRMTPSGKIVFELFDPVGVEVNEETAASGGSIWRWYLDGGRGGGLNGEGLRPFLTTLRDAGVQLSYNGPNQGPQPLSANSCGLWCIVRAWVPAPSPSEFGRMLRPVPLHRNERHAEQRVI